MSILPSDAQRSSSSSSKALSQNPSIDNGLFQDPEFVESSIPAFTDTQTLGSVQISDSHSATSHSDGISGQLAAADFSGSSKKVNELQTLDGKKSSSRRNHTTSSHIHLGQGALSSQFKYDQVGSSQPRVKSGAVASPHSQSSSGSIIFSGTATHSATRKNQTMNGNHLLNFHYDPISRPQQRITPPRRQQKIKPYNRDLFLQAHYKFVVLDTGNYTLESMDPDKMLQWEDVICVRYSTPFHVHCPICLESPLCPQITSCGHIFCFPCILRYLLMGEEDHKGDSWKKCPLCFVMISLKDLYTIYIEYVNQYRVGDNVQFALLTRPKDCLIPSQKNQQGADVRPCISNDLSDSFSRFTLTSDVDISVRQAKSELYDWLARAESGLVDDLEKLPYVSAALEQLEQRKNHWSEHGGFSNSPPLGNCASPCSSTKVCGYNSSKEENNVLSSVANADVATFETCGLMRANTSCVGFKDESKWLNSSSVEKLGGEDCLVQTADLIECEGQRVLSSSYDESKSLQRHSNVSKDIKEKDSYTFYQAVDGQHLILHPLNMKCLLHYYGSYDFLPSRISGKILQLETVTQSEAMRRRYRFLSHFSLTTTFQLCEIDLSEMFPLDAIYPFVDEIKKREKERKRLAKKEQEEKIKAEAAAMRSVPISGGFGQFSDSNVPFSMDEFEALGSSTISSSSPPAVGERKLFSDVTRLGFAAAHDSPSLNVDESANLTSAESTAAPRNMVILSFANIASAAKSGESVEAPKTNGLGKKGKKPSRVLLSTATGRRY